MKILYCGYRNWALSIYDYLKNNLDFITFKLVINKEELKTINTSEYDLLLFIGWSWIIPKSIVDKGNCICFHPSPLPKYRGGSPIQHQIINGETESKVTLFVMDEGLDTGPIIDQETFSLKGDLEVVLSDMERAGTWVLHRFLNDYRKTGVIKSTPQNNEQSSTFKRRTPEMSEITHWELNNLFAHQLYNKIRSLQDPYPNAYIKCVDGEKLYITKARLEK